MNYTVQYKISHASTVDLKVIKQSVFRSVFTTCLKGVKEIKVSISFLIKKRKHVYKNISSHSKFWTLL